MHVKIWHQLYIYTAICTIRVQFLWALQTATIYSNVLLIKSFN